MPQYTEDVISPQEDELENNIEHPNGDDESFHNIMVTDVHTTETELSFVDPHSHQSGGK